MGKKVVLSPRNLAAETDGDSLGEDPDKFPPRICVAPSVAHCLLAIPEQNLDGRKGLWVYSTQAEKKNIRCGTEYDTSVTQEKWLLTPHTFRLEARLPGEVAIFTRMWVYSDNYGHELYLPRKDRLALWRIRLRGIRLFLKQRKDIV